MGFTAKLGQLLNRRWVLAALLLVAIIVTFVTIKINGDSSATDEVSQNQVVTLSTSAQYTGNQSLALVGTARAFTEANVTSEKSGRVVAVKVKLGQSVKAGTILATIENAAEQAAVLQAEGAYDAAVAASAQSDVGLDEAKNNLEDKKTEAVSAFKSAYNTTNGIILSSIDPFFSNPTGFVPGLRINGKGFTAELNSTRVVYQQLLPQWKNRVDTITSDSDLESELEYARENIQRTIGFVDTFILLFSRYGSSDAYSEADIQGYSSSFTNLRSTLIGIEASLDGAKSGLQSAEEGVKRAGLAASGGRTSASDAQIKQALGVLRAAEANLAKTILRTPISGTVNSLSIRTGDYISGFTPVAVVANNSALEIVTYVSESEQSLLAVGDTVTIENETKGTVAQIAPAVDNITGKIEVRIAVEDTVIKNGDTVRITKDFTTADAADVRVIIPLTAVKFEREDGFIFKVTDDVLVKEPVSLGAILGGGVEIVDGLATTDEFVLDARGLVAGEHVEVTQ